MAFQRKKPAAIGVKAPFPGFVEPALATSIDKVPSGDRWIHEIKFDGYRVQVHLVNEAVKVFTRRGNDWTKRFRKVADDAWHIGAGSAIIDGEIVVPAADGTTDFSVLQNELKGKSAKIVLVAFDLLYLNGYDLRKLPLIERKAHLKKIIDGTDVQFSESFEVDGKEMFAHACKVGLEGVVSKVRDSRYPSGRGRDWVKKTCAQRETLTIAGFALDGNDWDGIYVGRKLDLPLPKSDRLPKLGGHIVSCVHCYDRNLIYGFQQQSARYGARNFAPSEMAVHIKSPHPPHGLRGQRGLVRNCPNADQSAIHATRVHRMKHGSVVRELSG